MERRPAGDEELRPGGGGPRRARPARASARLGPLGALQPPPEAHLLAKATHPPHLPHGTEEGKNDWGRIGWRGPCPPIGRHRYYFRLYALDALLPDLHEPNRHELDAAMKGHVLGTASLMGTYQKAH